MIRSYQLAATIKINHEYFQDNKFDGLEIVPTPETQNYLDREGVQVKQAGDTFSFYVNSQSTSGGQLPNTANLIFYLVVNNANFFNFTNLPLTLVGKVLFFKTEQGKTGITKNSFAGKADLVDYRGQYFILSDMENAAGLFYIKNASGEIVVEISNADSEQLTLDLSQLESGYYELWRNEMIESKWFYDRHFSNPHPFGFLMLELDYPSTGNTPPEYQLNFAARRTIWRYFLINRSSVTFPDLKVASSDESPAFFQEDDVTLANGDAAKVFSSDPENPIPLAAYPSKRITLSSASNGLKLELPHATPDHIQAVRKGNEVFFYSDIYVYL